MPLSIYKFCQLNPSKKMVEVCIKSYTLLHFNLFLKVLGMEISCAEHHFPIFQKLIPELTYSNDHKLMCGYIISV